MLIAHTDAVGFLSIFKAERQGHSKTKPLFTGRGLPVSYKKQFSVERISHLLGSEKFTIYHLGSFHLTTTEPSSHCIFLQQVALLVNEEPQTC